MAKVLRKKAKSASRKGTKGARKVGKPLRRSGKGHASTRKTVSRAKISSKKVTRKSKKTAKKAKSSGSARAFSIVRIMGRGQYKLAGADLAKLNRIDNSIVKFVENHHDSSDSKTQRDFLAQLNQMISIVTSRGTEIPQKEIIPSDIILPFEDTTLEEARELFKGEGLIPG